MNEPADKPDHRSQRLPALPKPGPRFYLRVRQGRVRDHRVRRMVRVLYAVDFLSKAMQIRDRIKELRRVPAKRLAAMGLRPEIAK